MFTEQKVIFISELPLQISPILLLYSPSSLAQWRKLGGLFLFGGGGGCSFSNRFSPYNPIVQAQNQLFSVVLSFDSLLEEGNEKPQAVFIDSRIKGYWYFTMIDDCSLESKNMVWAAAST